MLPQEGGFTTTNDYNNGLFNLRSVLAKINQDVDRIFDHNRVVMDSQKKLTLQKLIKRFHAEVNKTSSGLTHQSDQTERAYFLMQIGHVLCTMSSPHLGFSLNIFSLAKINNLLSWLEALPLQESMEEINQKIDPEWWYILEAMGNLHCLAAAELIQPDIKEAPPLMEAIQKFKMARNQVYYQGLKLLGKLYADRHATVDDYQLLASTVAHSTDYFEGHTLANKKELVKFLTADIHQLQGKASVYWKDFCKALGAFLMISGTVFIGLGVAAIPVSFGTSSVGIKIGYSMTIAGSLLMGHSLFKYGQKKSTPMAGAVANLKDTGEKAAKKIHKG